MAVLPTREFSIEFDAGVWTDVFADVVTVTTRRGRNRELGAFETGTGTVVLRNETRKYDPEHAAGTYYGKLRPNRRIRFRAVYSAVTYPVFQGYIDRITQQYEGPNGATTTITFSDLFKVLNRVDLPSSVYVTEVLADTPAALWPLDEPVGATTVSDATGNGWTLDVAGTPKPVFGQQSLITREPRSGVLVTSGLGQSIGRYFTGRIPATGPPITLETWFQRTVDGSDGGMVGVVCDPLSHGMFALFTSSTVIDALAVNGANTQTLANTTGVDLDDNLAHHIVATWDAAGALKIYVDGVDRTSGAPTCANVAFLDTSAWVHAAASPAVINTDPDTGVAQMAAIYNTALSAARIAAHNTAGRTPWNGDLPGTRAGRILDLAAVPAGDRTLDAGTTTLQATSLAGTALAYLQKIEATELGEVFVTRDGKVRLLGRQASFTGTYLTSQASFVDDPPAGAEVAYREGGPVYDVADDDMLTRATVSRDGSVAVTFYDAAAKAEFGWLDFTADGLLHDSDVYSGFYAEWIVNTHKAPTTRAGTIEIAPAIAPTTAYPKVLGLEIGDRVTVKRRPKVGAAILADMRVEAIQVATGPSMWSTVFQLSPFNLAGGFGPGVWDTSLWDQAVWGL